MFAAPPRSESAPAQVGPEPYTAAPQTEPAKEQVSAEAYAPPSHSPSFLGLSSGPSSAPYTAPAPEAPPQRRHLPVWLMTPIFAVVFVGVVWGIYSLVHTGGNSAPAAAVANSAAKSATPPNPYQQYIELSGVRFTVDAKKKPVVKFVVTNHSDADIQGLEANVTVLSHTQTSDTPVGTFSFKTEVGPNQSKDLTAPFDTKMQMVELPDWQFVKVDVQITAAGS